jgi:KH domain
MFSWGSYLPLFFFFQFYKLSEPIKIIMADDKKEKTKGSRRGPQVSSEGNSNNKLKETPPSTKSDQTANTKKNEVVTSPSNAASSGKSLERDGKRNDRRGPSADPTLLKQVREAAAAAIASASSKSSLETENKRDSGSRSRNNGQTSTPNRSSDRDANRHHRKSHEGGVSSVSSSSPSHHKPSHQHSSFTFKNGHYSESLDIPFDLLDFASSPAGADFFEQTRIKSAVDSIKFERIRAGSGQIRISGVDQASVRLALSLIQLHLEHQEILSRKLQRAAAWSSDLAAAQQEIEAGLRVEFTVPSDVLGYVIGKLGANITRVKEITGVDRIVVDRETDPVVVRIRGSSREKVSHARQMLEYTVRNMKVTSSQADWIMGTEGQSLDEIREKSRVKRLEVVTTSVEKNSAVFDTSPVASVLIVGLKTDVDVATALIEAQLEFQAKYYELEQQEKLAKEKLRKLDISFGDAYAPRISSDRHHQRREPVKHVEVVSAKPEKTPEKARGARGAQKR